MNVNDPIHKRRRNPSPISDEHLPPRDAFDREVDNAAREGRQVDYEKLRETLYACLSDEVPNSLPEHSSERPESVAFYRHIEGKEVVPQRIMYRLLERQFPVSSIARVMGMSVRQAYRVRDNFKKNFQDCADDSQFLEYVGKTIWIYEEWTASFLRICDDESTSVGDKIKALREACKVKNSEISFLHLIGFFDGGGIYFKNKDSK